MSDAPYWSPYPEPRDPDRSPALRRTLDAIRARLDRPEAEARAALDVRDSVRKNRDAMSATEAADADAARAVAAQRAIDGHGTCAREFGLPRSWRGECVCGEAGTSARCPRCGA